jgi:centromere protein J
MSSLDPNLMAYLQCSILLGTDPAALIEMQANYLRMVANMITEDPAHFNLARPVMPEMSGAPKMQYSTTLAQQSAQAAEEALKIGDLVRQPSDQFAMPFEFQPVDFSGQKGRLAEPVLTERNLTKHNQHPSTDPQKAGVWSIERAEKLNEKPEIVTQEAQPTRSEGHMTEVRALQQHSAELVKSSSPWALAEQNLGQILNPEDLPVKGVTNFEKLLEEKLSEEGGEPTEERPLPKKEYLRRRTKKSTIPKTSIERSEKSSRQSNEGYEEDDSDESKPPQPFLKRGSGSLCSRTPSSARQRTSTAEPQSSVHSHDSRLRTEADEGESSSRERSHLSSRNEDLLKEIHRMRAETNRLRHMRADLENRRRQLEGEMKEFHRRRDADLKDREAWKEEELRRMRRAQRTSEQTGRQTREEALQLQVERLEEELRLRDLHYRQETQNLRAQVDELRAAHLVVQPATEDTGVPENSSLAAIFISPEVQPGSKASLAVQPKSSASPEIRPELKGLKILPRVRPNICPESKTSQTVQPELRASPKETLEKSSSTPGAKLVSKPTVKPSTKEISQQKETSRRMSPQRVTPQRRTLQKATPQRVSPQRATPHRMSPQKAAPPRASAQKVTPEKTPPSKQVTRSFSDGHKEVIFPNGVRREVYPDGYTVVYFTNKDIKQSFPDGKVIYFFAEANTQQTTLPDGQQIFKFASGQTEHHFPDNTREIKFPDGTVKCIFPDGEEESIFPDGSIQKVCLNGVKYIDFVNGVKDTLFPDGTKIRELTDGRVRKILPDGRVIEN